MTTSALITKLKKKITKETDKGILKSIDILLKNDTDEAREQRRMTEKALLSEWATAKGDVVPWEEVRTKLQSKIDKSRASKAKRQ
ncbi:MAG: hypothetical protein IPJ76_12595 [Flavobacteriales bacterium]|nr:MAG: hypothetical protein IPJ76_12595 [Flavobacteriales bacterium]